MKHIRLTKQQSKDLKNQRLEVALAGKGKYRYKNASRSSLKLPKVAFGNVRECPAGGTFEGDDYFLQLVRTGELRLLEVLEDPNAQEEAVVSEQKLILDQPDRVTTQGRTEQVVVKPAQKLNEVDQRDPKEETLLIEAPGGFIVLAE